MEGGGKKIQEGGGVYVHIWLIPFVVWQEQTTVKQLHLNFKNELSMSPCKHTQKHLWNDSCGSRPPRCPRDPYLLVPTPSWAPPTRYQGWAA